ncbi:MAG: hypothetical protein H0X33_13280 [Taibaiella sp.]|nr:hypothetical protein [Taibaiella sp.]
MKTLVSQVKTIDSATGRNLQTLAGQQLNLQRKASVPVVGLVNNFDPDQKNFLTTPMKGYTMLQVGSGVATYGALAVNADYNVLPPGQDFSLRPEPGKPALIYPVAGGNTSLNTSFIHGDGNELKRYYPIKYLTRGFTGSGTTS